MSYLLNLIVFERRQYG